MSRALIVGAILSAGLLSGGMLMQSGAWHEASAASATPRLLDQVTARIRRDYIDSVPLDELRRKAAFGLVRELDDAYSSLLTPERAERLREQTTGQYAGIGVELDIRDGQVTVIAPLAGTPADSAGILPGDRIVAIDGLPPHDRAVDDVQQALRGRAGTRIRLTVERGGNEHTFTITRRVIEFHPVQRTALLSGNVAYVELAAFSERAAAEVRAAVDRLRRQGATALLLDLRGNPGGLLEQGIEVAELFLDAGREIASTAGRTAESARAFRATKAQAWPGMPMAVLVDSGTASAAEIVAGAVQDNDRGVIVGTPSYGKGSAQSLYPVTEGHVLKLTTARWFTPSGRTIERDSASGGITPDVTVRDTIAVPRRLAGASLESDPMIARALAALTGARRP